MMTYWRLFFYAFCCIISSFSGTGPLYSQEQGSSSPEPLKIELIAENTQINPNERFAIALHVSIAPSWHAYWKNPGDAGVPPQITWQLPPGFTVEELEWPIPKRFENSGLVTFGYEGDIYFLASLKAPEKLEPEQSLPIAAELQYVVCSEEACLPGTASAQHSAIKSGTLSNLDTQRTALFETIRKQLPLMPKIVSVKREKGMIELVVQGEKLQQVENNTVCFIPENKSHSDSCSKITVVPSSIEQRTYTIVMPDDSDQEKQGSIKGLFVAGSGEDAVGWSIDTALAKVSIAEEEISVADPQSEDSLPMIMTDAAPQEEISSLWLAILFALIGGLILNLMPCVLPVISIKILSFVQMAGHKRSAIFQHGLSFSLGVLVSFWLLAGLLLTLQAYGQSVGWGFQLQEPLFVGTLATLLFMFALSLFGVFEMGAFFASMAGGAQGHRKGGLSSSFMSGVLATAVATPCTGPFLGSAVGYAVTLPAWEAMLVFTAVGLGMSLPYLFLAAFPNFLRWLPKPGVWMVAFKQLMGFLMLGAVLWLTWVFGSQTDNLALMMLLCGFFFIAMGCWIYGTWCTPIRKKWVRGLSLALALCVGGMGAGIIYKGTIHDVSGAPSEIAMADDELPKNATGGWEPFSLERIEALQKQGIPVFVDFTAKWCLICQTNHLVLSASDVQAAFMKKGVVKMKADWTKSDPEITQTLRSFGRSSVPLYLLYTGNPSDAPKILPQVLTPETVIEQIASLP